MYYSVKVINDISQLTAYKTLWNELLKNSYSNNYFLTYEWVFYNWKYFRNKRKLLIILFYTNDNLVAIAPLSVAKKYGLKVIGFIGEGKSDYQDIILHKSLDVKNFVMVFEKYLAKNNYYHILDLHPIDSNSYFVNDIKNNKSIEKKYNVEKFDVSPKIIINKTWVEYLKSRKNKLLKDTERQIKRIEQLGNLNFRIINEENERAKIINYFIAQKSSRKYKIKRTSNPFDGFNGKNFLNDISNLSNINSIHISCLQLDNTILATHIGIFYEDKLYYYMPSFNMEYERYSVGRILLYYLLEYSFKVGLKEFDFLNGDETYKYDWNNSSADLVCVTAFKNKLVKTYFTFAKNIGYNNYLIELIRKNKYFIYIYKKYIKVNILKYFNVSI